MRTLLLCLSIIISFFCFITEAGAQGNQTVGNGEKTQATNFPTTGCTYTWVNGTPGIGLAATGIGDISSFTAVNTGNSAVTATITATPIPTAFAYIPNALTNNVSVINTLTQKVIATIPVGKFPSHATVSSDGKWVYVTNGNSNSVSVISTASNTVIATINGVASPWSISVTPDGHWVYVTDLNSKFVSVINASTNTITSTISVGLNPDCVSVSPDGRWAYVTVQSSKTISVISTQTNKVVATINTNIEPGDIAVTPDGSTLYITNINTNNVSAINIATNTVVATIPVGIGPEGLVVSPDGSRVYVANENGVTVIDVATNKVSSNILAGRYSVGISISSDGSLLYVANTFANTVSVINTATNNLISTINVNTYPESYGNFISNGPGCQGAPITFNITVNPTPALPPTITASPVTGSISSCAGSASISPNIEQVTISGSSLPGDILATVPTVFEISLSANSGYGNFVTLPVSGGSVANTVLYIRAAASATAGNYSGHVTLSSGGTAGPTVNISETINKLPTVNTIQGQTRNSGAATAAINFTGTGNTFTWINDTPGIGLAASGSGNIPSFTAINTGTIPIMATITVTPVESGYVYMSNTMSNTVSAINTITNQVATQIPAKEPWGIVLSPDGSTLYVAENASNTILVISTLNNTVTGSITVEASPFCLGISPDGSSVYVTYAAAGSPDVSVISTTTNKVTATIPVDNYLYGITVSPDGAKVYVAQDVGSVYVIDTKTNTVTGVIPLGTAGYGAVVSPGSDILYVTNPEANTVQVINALTNAIIATIPVGAYPNGIAINPSGSRIYVPNTNSSTVSVINTASNKVIATIPVGSTPYAISFSPDGNLLYVANIGPSTVSVIDPTTNKVVNTFPSGGLDPESFGTFVKGNPGCTGPPISFTITVLPAIPPSMTVSQVTGSISACEGTASTGPDIEQFTVSGANLVGDITVTAPTDFEVSSSQGSGYGNSIILAASAGSVNNAVVYVRSAASAKPGSITGNVMITCIGASNQATVTGTINTTATVNPINPLSNTSGQLESVHFTGTATNFTWTNDSPGIGLPANGTGDIMPFTTVNNGKTPVMANIKVMPVPVGTECTGPPTSFTITVYPSLLPPAISNTLPLSPLTTVYGTPSASTSFTSSGTSMLSGITVTPPFGFEVSTDNVNFSSSLTFGAAGDIPITTIYVRLTATTPVGSSYSGDITLTSNGATTLNPPIPVSAVTPAPLIIVADNKSRIFGVSNPVFTATYTGFVNKDGPASLLKKPTLNTTAVITSAPGQYAITVSGATAANYNITQLPGILTIGPTLIIPNAFTPNGDGINDTWNIKYLDTYKNCTVQIFTRYGANIFSSIGYGIAWNGTYDNAALPTGTYYYVIDLQDGGKPLSGFVALIR